MCAFCGDMFHVIDREMTRENISDVIMRNDFVNRALNMILIDQGHNSNNRGINDQGYQAFVNAGGIDDEFIDTLFTTHVFDVSREFIENEYEIDIFDLYENDIDSAAQMIEEMFVYYAHSMNNMEGK